jgi:hypothetical protein
LGLNSAGSGAFIDAALSMFEILRAPSSGLRKKPATAELLDWMLALRQIDPQAENPLENPLNAQIALSSLTKTSEDAQRAKELVQRWITERNTHFQSG